jgi:hypothetical protein
MEKEGNTPIGLGFLCYAELRPTFGAVEKFHMERWSGFFLRGNIPRFSRG